jgi:hypothetical protein
MFQEECEIKNIFPVPCRKTDVVSGAGNLIIIYKEQNQNMSK